MNPPVLHLVTTPTCMRNCKYCCNKQYNLDDVPEVSEEELRLVEEVCLTGGEPVVYSKPNEIAKWLKTTYPNIKRVYVYANAMELAAMRRFHNMPIDFLDGISISIKNFDDKMTFEYFIATDKELTKLPSNLVYIFDNLVPKDMSKFKSVMREWQPDFKPADNCIFRKKYKWEN